MNPRAFWPTLIPVLGVLISQFSDVITAFLASHPNTSLLVVTLVTALANLVTPTKPELKKPE